MFKWRRKKSLGLIQPQNQVLNNFKFPFNALNGNVVPYHVRDDLAEVHMYYQEHDGRTAPTYKHTENIHGKDHYTSLYM